MPPTVGRVFFMSIDLIKTIPYGRALRSTGCRQLLFPGVRRLYQVDKVLSIASGDSSHWILGGYLP